MLAEPRVIAEVLGIRPVPVSPMDMVRRIEEGLPTATVERVANRLAPADVTFRNQIVPKATLARRKKTRHPLSREESARVARIAAIWARACGIWKDEAKAREFLLRPHPMLEGRRPFDVALRTDVGADLVDRILGRLEYGSAA